LLRNGGESTYWILPEGGKKKKTATFGDLSLRGWMAKSEKREMVLSFGKRGQPRRESEGWRYLSCKLGGGGDVYGKKRKLNVQLSRNQAIPSIAEKRVRYF